MDDYGSIKASPQNPYLGLFSDGVGAVDRSLQGPFLGAVSNGLGIPAAARVLEDMSYGSPPYRGTGMATKLTPDGVAATGAALNLLGGLPIGHTNRLLTGATALPMIENHSLDSVIQNLLNMMGNRNK